MFFIYFAIKMVSKQSDEVLPTKAMMFFMEKIQVLGKLHVSMNYWSTGLMLMNQQYWINKKPLNKTYLEQGSTLTGKHIVTKGS